MSQNRHIVHASNKKTVQHKYRRKNQNGKLPKRGTSQINERPTRPHSTTVPKHATNARIPSNNKNPQVLRRLLRPKHNLSTTERARKERFRQQRVEHEQRKTQKSVQTNKRRSKHTELHRRFTQLHMQKNKRANNLRCNSRTIQPNIIKSYAKKNATTPTNHVASTVQAHT